MWLSREVGHDFRTLSTLVSMAALTLTLASSFSRTWMATKKTWVTLLAMRASLSCVSSEFVASKVMYLSTMEDGNQLGSGRLAMP